MEYTHQKIYDYYGDIPSQIFPENFFEYLISSELLRDNIPEGTDQIDYMSLAIGYLKSIDAIIEKAIATPFRSYIAHNNIEEEFYHDHLERALASCAFHHYSISLGRLSECISLLRSLQSGGKLFYLFREFLDENSRLKKSLLDDDLLVKLESLSKLDIQSKRHKGILNTCEFEILRHACVGDFKNDESISKILLESQL